MPSNKAELYKEARRCADAASKGVSPGHQRLFTGLSRFYETLAKLEPELDAFPKTSPAGVNSKLEIPNTGTAKQSRAR